MSKVIPMIAMAVISLIAADAQAAGNSSNASKEAAFKAECELLGGRFKRDRQTGTLVCLADHGFKICDRGVRNCKYHPNARIVVPAGSTVEDGGAVVY